MMMMCVCVCVCAHTGEAGDWEDTALECVLSFQTFTSVESGFTTKTSYSYISLSKSLPEQLNPLSFPPYPQLFYKHKIEFLP